MRWTAGVAALAATALLSPAAPAEPAATQPVGMVINGGISLGAYQAGVTYALMRFVLERRAGQRAARPLGADSPLMDGVPLDFQIATGSSAGNINAFLAALSWCDQQAFQPRHNLFWDTWINVGLGTLSPTSPLQEDYARLFANPDASPDFPRTPQDVHPPDGWRPDRSIYSADDGLLTRNAFLAALENLRRRLGRTTYRQCLVKIGITATRADVVRLANGAATQRFVVPLDLHSHGCRGGRDCGVAVTNHLRWLEQPQEHEDIGKFMMLPQQVPENDVSAQSVFDLITASSAFPVAFAPKPLDRCVLPDPKGQAGRPAPRDQAPRPAQGGGACPPGLVLGQERYIDGGLFDNIPLGLALELNDHPSARQREPIYLYVDDSARRPEAAAEVALIRANGLPALFHILGDFIDQTRQYELQALTRYKGNDHGFINGRLFTTSRLLPLAGEYLGNFGAFPRAAFRKTDYFIGIYDGVHTLAEALGSPVTPAAFAQIQHLVLDGDDELLKFTSNLFNYERYWTGLVDGTLPVDHCRGTELTDLDVQRTFQALCQIDEETRILARAGSQGEIDAYQKLAGSYHTLLQTTRADHELGDLNEWEHATIDRLLRRAIDVEKADAVALSKAKQRREQMAPMARLLDSDLVLDTLLVGRMALAAGMERGQEPGLTTSSVNRVLGHDLSLATMFFQLVPYDVVWDSVRSRAEIGWEMKLRHHGKYLDRWLLAIDPALNWDPHDHQTPWSGRLALGVGVDPKDRLVDDVQLGPVAWSAQRPLGATISHLFHRPTTPASVGVEASLHLVGSKLRLAVGAPKMIGRLTDAGWDWGRVDRHFSTLLDGFYVTIGFSDLNGSLAWLARSGSTVVAGTCEEMCDEDIPPRPTRRITTRLPAGKAYP